VQGAGDAAAAGDAGRGAAGAGTPRPRASGTGAPAVGCELAFTGADVRTLAATVARPCWLVRRSSRQSDSKAAPDLGRRLVEKVQATKPPNDSTHVSCDLVRWRRVTLLKSAGDVAGRGPSITRCPQGSTLSVSAPSPQILDDTNLRVRFWSDSGPQRHTIVVSTDPTITATYVARGP
jgi:hypothetical protein